MPKRLVTGLILALLAFTSCREEPEVILSGNCELLSFGLESARNGLLSPIEFDFDRENRTLKAMYLTWIDSEDPEMMIPEFRITGKEARVDGKPVISGKTPISFAEPFTLTVYAENGRTEDYHIDLNCPQINTELPVLRLQPSAPLTSKTDYVETVLTLYSPDTDQGWWEPGDGTVGVRGRGNSTWLLPKKPYRIKFPEKFSPVGLDHAREKSWVILAHDMDKSLLRNHLGFTISKILFSPAENRHHEKAILFTPCSQFVNVYMGDKYHGIYQMSDQMNKADGRIDVEKLTEKDGADPERITGGHILETDVHQASAPVRFRTSLKGIQINHKYPDEEDFAQAQYEYIEQFVDKAESVLYGGIFKDPVDGWRKCFDEKTLVDFIIAKELAGDMDGYTSTYLYKRRGVDKLFFGPVWDVDKGWDNERRGAADFKDHLMIHSGFVMPGGDKHHWFYRFWEDENLRKAVNERWVRKRQELLDAIEVELTARPAGMVKSIEANFTVWPFYYQASTEAKMPASTYPDEINRIRRLTADRAAVLDSEFAK